MGIYVSEQVLESAVTHKNPKSVILTKKNLLPSAQNQCTFPNFVAWPTSASVLDKRWKDT